MLTRDRSSRLDLGVEKVAKSTAKFKLPEYLGRFSRYSRNNVLVYETRAELGLYADGGRQ